MRTEEFDGIEREVGGEVGLAVIWLHGLGADASDFLPIVDALDVGTGVRYVFPNAPVRAVTINGGFRMRAWYDILGFGPDSPEDQAGIAESAGRVRGLVAREIGRGIPAERIVLAGFSQGGAVVLHAGLSGSERIAGILGLSTYLPAPALLAAAGPVSTEVPVLLVHGTDDPVIPLALAERSAALLEAAGVPLERLTYRMGHEVVGPEVVAINDWLRKRVSR